MEINKLIKKLKKLRNKYGSVEVYMIVFDDGDTSYESIGKVEHGINDEIIIDWE